MAFDEHRLGLKPISRHIWALKGQRPVAKVQYRYEWLYLYAFANPQTGQSVFYILPGVDAESLSRVLENLALELGASQTHAVLLVLDQAGWHTTDRLRVPQGIELLFLPSYSPELQPVEHLWSLTDEPLANRSFDTLDDLQNLLAERCAYLRTQPDLIAQHTLFHWWPLT
jgi:transposase